MARDPPEGAGAWAGAGGGGFRALIAEKSRCTTLMCAKVATKRIVVNHSNVGGANMKD